MVCIIVFFPCLCNQVLTNINSSLLSHTGKTFPTEVHMFDFLES
jgi:hypothetical protein